jgi:hypothetical protein
MSIESKICAYLSADAALLALLGGTVKIYPLRNVDGAAAPYIVYQLAAEGGYGRAAGRVPHRREDRDG